MFTDVANGINLYYGPDPNATVKETEGDDGRIKKAHPIWGVLMLTTPFIPMIMACLFVASQAVEGWWHILAMAIAIVVLV